jgi:flagellar biosynthesis anti-sigma factor FlgM
MKILSNFLSNVTSINKVNKTEKQSSIDKNGNVSSTKKDEVILSKDAENFKLKHKTEIDYYKAKLGTMKETENEKVADIKQKYQSGQYNVDLSKVADSFLDANPEFLNILK